MAEITTKKRNALPANQFALPATRQYPIHDAAHVRAAASRLEQHKGTISPARYAEAKRNIARAAKKFGVESMFNKPAEQRSTEASALRKITRRGLHMQIGLAPDGGHRIEVMHAVEHPAGVLLRDVAGAFGVPLDIAGMRADEERAAALEAEVNALALDAPGRPALLADATAARAAAAAPRWNQIAKVGVFRGHPAGSFELTPAIFDEIGRNYSDVDLGKVALDFEHASEADETEGSIPQEGAPAQGWVLQLDNRGVAGLWGLIRFLEPARSYVLAEKYIAFSPAIRFGARHPETGKPIGARLTSVALTNKPFLRGLAPLAAKDTNTGASAPTTGGDRMSTTHTLDASDKHMMAPGAFFQRLKDALKLHPLSSAADCKVHLGKLRALCEMADHPNAEIQGVNLGDYLHPLKAMMNLAEHEATPAQILDAVEEMIDAAIAIHEAEQHGETTMTIETNEMTMTAQAQDLAVKLGEVKSKLEVLAAQKTAVDTELAVTTTKLKDAEHKLTEATTRASKAEADIKAMEAANIAREETELQARVDTAFATYKDAKKLTDKDRAQMLIVAKADPKLFADCYPPVTPGTEHLLRNITTDRAAITNQRQGVQSRFAVGPGGVRMNDRRPQTVDGPASQGQEMSVEQMTLLSDKLRKMGRTHEKAISEAYAIARGTMAMPAELASN